MYLAQGEKVASININNFNIMINIINFYYNKLLFNLHHILGKTLPKGNKI